MGGEGTSPRRSDCPRSPARFHHVRAGFFVCLVRLNPWLRPRCSFGFVQERSRRRRVDATRTVERADHGKAPSLPRRGLFVRRVPAG
jgi:hypothetical protein